MKTNALQLTLREMHELATSARAWGVMAVIVFILGISGPFQTYAYLSFGPRLVYWAVMGIVSFGVGVFFGTLAGIWTKDWKVHFLFRFIIIGISSGIPVAICVILLNRFALGYSADNLLQMLVLGGYSIGIAMAVAGLFQIFGHKVPTKLSAQPSKILSRLPVEKRGKLISMSMQDHYVEVVTSSGKHLVLIRLSDAIEETAGTPGLQIHRSHWVALDAVQSTKRQNGKVSIVTTKELELPVSRTYLPRVKGAGILA